ncbi:TrmB family transcriptional regulator [Paenibacillus arenosi]|uniref:TrmB family transcriptional regulator n=1 Tax=Paenibacillus arenosi TaxID=2774142 RepID=A0ABR9B1V9_9BACL|nr:helix-turn-helix domain-containing protein [Paenibacillus arenosi]MBD8499909.1 TrmB family transcriptional regulator [Paenibacillus arenosi]
MDSLIQQLRDVGFTELESKLLILLSEQGSMTGYEAAKKLGISRSNVYAALQRLVDQSFVLHAVGEPSHYAAIEPAQLTKTIAERMQASLRFVEEHMPSPKQELSFFYSIEGDKVVAEKIGQVIAAAEIEIIVEMTSRDGMLVQHALQQAENRGVKVLWSISSNEEQLPASGFLASREGQVDKHLAGRRFTMIIDRKIACIGMRSAAEEAKLLYTEHPVMTEYVLSRFIQDIILFELEQQLTEEQRQHFGPYFSRLWEPYLNKEM